MANLKRKEVEKQKPPAFRRAEKRKNHAEKEACSTNYAAQEGEHNEAEHFKI